MKTFKQLLEKKERFVVRKGFYNTSKSVLWFVVDIAPTYKITGDIYYQGSPHIQKDSDVEITDFKTKKKANAFCKWLNDNYKKWNGIGDLVMKYEMELRGK